MIAPADTSEQAVIEAALLLPERMGLSPEDLVAVPRPAASAADPRREHPGRVSRGHDWNPAGVRLVLEPGPGALGATCLDELTPSEIRQLMVHVKATHVVAWCNARGGRSAAEHP